MTRLSLLAGPPLGAPARVFTLAFVLGVASAGCLRTVAEPDCLVDGTCECKKRADCPAGLDCVDGHCFLIPDAGHPGDFGTVCTQDADCTSGPCLPKGPGNGGVCTVACATDLDAGPECPRGWECKPSYATGALVCTPPYQALCLACRQDTDCNAAGDRCLELPGGERACGIDCARAACPDGTTCRSVMLDGGVARQCVPDSNTCTCSALSVGLKRSCTRANAIGRCFGFEICQADGGFSGCDARDAGPEVCNGVDDDCNGLLDGADPAMDHSSVAGWPDCKKGLSCTGKVYCGARPDDGGFGFLCSAPEPRQESCNGIDDDCNGKIDDGLVNDAGVYVSVRACGSCNSDCFLELAHLATDGGADAGPLADSAACVSSGGKLTCQPLKCAKGYFVAPPQPGVPAACEKAVTSQCRPCTHSADCVVPGDECVAVGNDPGLACAQSCDPASPYLGCTGAVGKQDCCPVDSTCQLVSGKKLCVPQISSCACSPDRLGLVRSCLRTAGTAVCVGAQVCTDAGFGVCDTSKTALEVCDGRDNDCNGVTDDPFVNTQGSRTYDTDEHCGTCTTNCRARWSPTIQHAVGGCLADRLVSPHCSIVQCTLEAVPGGGACRQDADCTGGRTCDPTYRQCVKACTGTTGCGTGEQCLNNRCTRSCSTDTECTQAYGAPSKCGSTGVCAVTYQFNDSNKDDTDGCECPSAQGGVDEPDVSAKYPVAGMPYVDRDCDGIDGHEATSLFVWANSTSSKGTRAAPFKTIKEALTAFNPTQHTAILVAQGTYVEQVVLTSGAQLHGGYAPGFAQRDVITFPTLIEAPEPDLTASGARRGSVNAEGLTARTVLAGFTIRGYDVTSRTLAGQPARNSYAVYVKNAPGLVLQNNHVVGGRGGDAVPAVAGTAGANGGAGANGRDAVECNSANCTNESQTGGVGGTNAACATDTVGNAGAGSDLRFDPQEYGNGNGLNGHGGSNGIYEHSDPSQNAFCKYDCIVPSNGLAGGAALNGPDGSPGGGGAACSNAKGSIVGDDWAAPLGGSGGNGTNGRGGGGGGAGGCVSNRNPPSCTVGRLVGDLGGTGGAGGAGGCGGGQGMGAGGGGASFGVFIIGAAPQLDGNLIDIGFGGSGGQGGSGGYGGLGGPGGRGGLNTTAAWCAGQGGPGGRGGNGGAGAGGGGGCGGSAFGIAGNGADAQSYDSRNTFAAAPLVPFGAGGPGGHSPAGTNFNGGDGASGVFSNLQAF